MLSCSARGDGGGGGCWISEYSDFSYECVRAKHQDSKIHVMSINGTDTITHDYDLTVKILHVPYPTVTLTTG